MKLYTQVIPEKIAFPLSLSDRIVLLGSCFADEMSRKLQAAGFEVCANPFGTLYNPASIASAIERLDSAEDFGPQDCVQMGAGAGKVCSFSHHTSFARSTAEEFLQNANTKLQEAREFWNRANRVILTLGTAMVWCVGGKPVSNCLKRPAAEFERKAMGTEDISACLAGMVSAHPEKRFMLTVSPIRHMGDGAHANALSKARLLLAADACTGADYFPAFEILTDELRDYRFYAEDLVHPSPTAVDIIWERFLDSCTLPSERDAIEDNEKAARRSAHRLILAE